MQHKLVAALNACLYIHKYNVPRPPPPPPPTTLVLYTDNICLALMMTAAEKHIFGLMMIAVEKQGLITHWLYCALMASSKFKHSNQ
jgi:hypothetical protein